MSENSTPHWVLLPGLACDAAVWEPLLPHLEGVATPWLPDLPVTESLSAMATAVLQQAPAERFALAGHSMGGRIALEVMRQAPHRVERLALLDTGWQPRPAGAAGEAEAAQRLRLVAMGRRDGMAAVGAQWSPGMLHPAHLGTPVHADVVAMVARQSVERFAAQQQALLDRPDASDVLDAITCPTLVLCGREDTWSPLARHEEMARRIQEARLVVVPNCGHMSTMEQAPAVAEAMRDWLQAGGAPVDAALRWQIDAACRDTVARAARLTDRPDPAGFAALFTDNAALQRPSGDWLHGRAAIQAAYAARPAQRCTRHLVASSVVDVLSADTARVWSTVLLWRGDTSDSLGPQGRPAQGAQIVGEFEDTLQRQSDGCWRIAQRVARFVLHSPG